ncbi:DUF2478 domain-containing protein [Stappia stellulata]|uniref:DUF2478 domain-containing protein n=1 Tax=Stappia stellulata TaxID=71235 RepID=UPI0004017997|nr:DUF2478 domain-containing protein [Stappia stellulata]
MKIAYTMAQQRGDMDRLLAGVAEALAARGLRCCGIVQINSPDCDDRTCDMDVQVLPDGPRIRISQSLGPEARGCRLDVGALETAVGECGRRLDSQADVLIVNKFGKREAEGGGFRDLIAEALSLDIPVIVGVNGLNEAAFLAFSAGAAVSLPPRADKVLDWVLAAAARLDETA